MLEDIELRYHRAKSRVLASWLSGRSGLKVDFVSVKSVHSQEMPWELIRSFLT